MSNIKFSLFDVFAYALPGLFTLIGIIILVDNSIVSLNQLVANVSKLNIASIILVILVSYILGFSIDSPGSWFYSKLACKINRNPGKDTRLKYNVNRAEEKEMQVLVREKSPENNQMLQNWKVLKTMSHNLAFTFLFLAIISLIKLFFFATINSLEWYLLSGGCILLFINLIYRAKVFDTWFYEELFNTAKVFKIGKYEEKK